MLAKPLAAAVGCILLLAAIPPTTRAHAAGAPSLCTAGTAGCMGWSAAYNGPGSGEDIGQAMVLSPDGSRVYVTGPSLGSSSFDYATVAYDSGTGAQLWAARYDGTGAGDDESTAIAVSPDGSRVFVTGESVGTTGGHDYATVAYDGATGSQLWVARYRTASSGDNYASAMGVSPDGARVYVTGWITTGVAGSGLPKYDIGTIAYTTTTGAQLWLGDYAGTGNPNGTGSDWDTAYALKVLPGSGGSDSVVVAGRSDIAGGATDLVALAYDGRSGQQRWVTLYSGPAHNRDIAYALAPSPDGARVYATGYDTAADGSTLDYVTVAIDASSGAQRWSTLYDANNAPPASTTGITVNSLAFGAAVSPDGARLAVTGTSGDWPGAYERSMTTIVYDTATGTQRWVARQPEPPDGGTGTAVAFSGDGATVYVAGAEGNDVFGVGAGSAGVTYDDTVALAAGYNAQTGSQDWLGSYGTTRQTGANALALSPDGSELYLTGGAQDSQSDIATMEVSTGVAPVVDTPESPWTGGFLAAGAAAALMAWASRRRRPVRR